MALLDIKIAKKITITCSLEESTALQVDQYAAFLKVPADDVVNTALQYVFSKDREFQKFREENTDIQALGGLRVKRALNAPTGARRGRKPGSAAAN